MSNSIIKSAKAVIAIEKNALEDLENKIDGEFVKACELISQCSAILDSEPAIKAVELMDGKNINSLPVLDKNKKIVGAINMHSLMQAKVV